MIHVIMGLKGSGKTKKLIDAINAAVADAHGDTAFPPPICSRAS